MSLEQHKIRNFSFEITSSATKDTYQILQQKLVDIAHEQLIPSADEVLEEQTLKNATIRLKRLELDLGEFKFSGSLEREIKGKFIDELRRALVSSIRDVKVQPEEGNEIISHAISDAELLIFYLKNGYIPWYAQPEMGETLFISGILQNLLTDSPLLIKQLLIQNFRFPYVKQRLIRQFSEKKILGIIEVISPINYQFIESIYVDLKLFVSLQLFSNISQASIKEETWLFLIELIVNNPNQKIEFIETLVQLFEKLKSKFFFSSDDFFQNLFDDLNKNINKSELSTPIFEAIQEILGIDVKESSLQKPDVFDELKLRDDESVLVKAFEKYLVSGELPTDWQTPKIQLLNKFWDILLSQKKVETVELYKKNWIKDQVRKRTLSDFSEQQIIKLVEITEPSNANFIVEYAKELDRNEEKKPTLKVGKSIYKKAKWEFILSYLFIERGSHFNKKIFIKSLLAKIAQRFNFKLEKFVEILITTLKEMDISPQLKYELPQLLLEIRSDIIKEKKLRLSADNYFEESFESAKQADLLKHYLIYGFVPWTEREKIRAVPIGEVISALIRKSPDKFRALMHEMKEEDKKKVVKRIEYQFSPEIAQTIFEKFKDVLPQLSQPKKISITEAMQDEAYIIFVLTQYLEKETIPEELLERNITRIIQAFFESKPAESQIFIRSLPAQEFEKIRRLLPEKLQQQVKDFYTTREEASAEQIEIITQFIKTGKIEGKIAVSSIEHILQETMKESPQLLVSVINEAISKPDRRKQWLTSFQEQTLIKLTHIISPLEFEKIHRTSQALLMAFLKTDFAQKKAINQKELRWEFILEYLGAFSGVFNEVTFIESFVTYIEQKYQHTNELSTLQLIQIFSQSSISLSSQNASRDIEAKLIEEELKAEKDTLALHQLGRRLRELQRIDLVARYDELVERKKLRDEEESIDLKELEKEIKFQKQERGFINEVIERLIKIQSIDELNQLFHQLAKRDWTGEVQNIISKFFAKEKVDELFSQSFSPEIYNFKQLQKIIQNLSKSSLSKIEYHDLIIERILLKEITAIIQILEIQFEYLFTHLQPQKIIFYLIDSLKKEKEIQREIAKQETENISELKIHGKDFTTYLEERVVEVLSEINEDGIEQLRKQIEEKEKQEKRVVVDVFEVSSKKMQIDIDKKEEELFKEKEKKKKIELEELERKEVEAKLRKIEEEVKTKVSSSEPKGFDLAKEAIYINNAGLVITHPYLTRLFNMLELTEKRAFKNMEAACRAVHILQYINNKTENNPEHELVLNKFLCGVDLNEPLEREVILTDKEKETCESMLQGIIQNWGILKTTSNDGFRASFLQREGRFKKELDGWRLKISERGYDILLDKLPWGIGMIKLPWMKNRLHVEWR